MKKERAAQLSVMDTLEALFKDTSIWGEAFNVYKEDDLRAGTTPVRPFVFLLAPYVNYEAKHLPVIVVETKGEPACFQLGTLSLRIWMNLYIFGRSEGERTDLATGIVENVDSIGIRNYVADPDDGTVIQTSKLVPGDDGEIWTTRIISPSGVAETVEATLLHFTMTSTVFWYL